jgi:predicted RNase H-like HicB family nuclease
MKVTAKTTRTNGWWAVEVPEVPGVFTQAKRLDQVPAMVRDAVSSMSDVPTDDVQVAVEALLNVP